MDQPNASGSPARVDAAPDVEKPRAGGARPKRMVPPLRNWIVSFCIFLVGAIVWWVNAFGDHAIGNIVLLICTFLAICWPIGWFTIFSGVRGWKRWVPFWLLAALVGLPFALGEIREVGGELQPKYYWRWSPKADETLALPPAKAAAADSPVADLATTHPDDFPQFLGPQRNSYIPRPLLAHDWTASPPQQVWQIPIGAGWSGFAVVNGFAVTMEQRGPQELVTCYDAATGKLVWSHGIAARYSTVLAGLGPRATPTIEGGHVYALGGTGVLRCIDGATGQLVWQKDLLKELGISREKEATAMLYGRSNSPLVVGQMVIVPAGGPGTGGKFYSLVAYHKLTGEEAWRGGEDQAAYASPAHATLGGVEQILSVNENTLTGHAVATGEVLWSHPWPGNSAGDSNNSQPLVVGDDRVFVSKSYGIGSALLEVAPAGGTSPPNLVLREVWKNSGVMKTKFCNVVIYKDHVYGLSDGILECIELGTGERKWKKGRYYQGQVLGVGDVLLVMHETKGNVVMVELNPLQHVELGSLQALDSDKVWNNLAVVGPHLFVRDAKTAACWQLPLAAP